MGTRALGGDFFGFGLDGGHRFANPCHALVRHEGLGIERPAACRNDRENLLQHGLGVAGDRKSRYDRAAVLRGIDIDLHIDGARVGQEAIAPIGFHLFELGTDADNHVGAQEHLLA